MTKAESINKKLIHDFIDLQNWLGNRLLDAQSTHIVFESKYERKGYLKALHETIKFMSDKLEKYGRDY